jgi:glycosyltransferase involved in cell wall biosynthesis
MGTNDYRVLVLDMQPISPPVGGGRLRLLGLYHALGERFQTTYIGSYDWPGEPARRQFLSASLEEITVPLSAEHFAASSDWQAKVGGKTIIDVTFPHLAWKSAEYLRTVREAVPKADAVVFSHPWVFPLVSDLIDRSRQLLVYDSQNVEGYLRSLLLDDGAAGSEIVREVARIECQLCRESDLVLACSCEDLEMFARLYDMAPERGRVVPNGVFVSQLRPVAADERRKRKVALGLPDRPAGFFIGSYYEPNLQAASFLAFELAPRVPDMTVVIAGGVGDGTLRSQVQAAGIDNVVVTGRLSEDDKRAYLGAADLALNPMTGGSGTNIKMFDFMAAGLGCVTTPVGARGIEWSGESPMIVCDLPSFVERVLDCMRDGDLRRRLGEAARLLATDRYSFERISSSLGVLLQSRLLEARGGRPPRVSVVVPTYERHDLLDRLCERLGNQEFRDFEVVVVDQSATRWANESALHGFELLYVHSDLKGAARARNVGASVARGDLLAFTDDDCLPEVDWLANAVACFEDSGVGGVEGLVRSEKLDSEAFRTVTNEFSELQGFLTANLFVRSRVFWTVNGFDEHFDNPHFREDTDFGWRASAHGEFRFARNVVVFHPPHPRRIARESIRARSEFFEKDALLFKKHPDKAVGLFRQEGHFLKEEYWEAVQRGCRKYQVDYMRFREVVEAGLLD